MHARGYTSAVKRDQRFGVVLGMDYSTRIRFPLLHDRLRGLTNLTLGVVDGCLSKALRWFDEPSKVEALELEVQDLKTRLGGLAQTVRHLQGMGVVYGPSTPTLRQDPKPEVKKYPPLRDEDLPHFLKVIRKELKR